MLYALAAVVAALIWLDRTYVLQAMIHRPIFLAPILGFILGNPEVGFLVGASLELLWLNAPPVGAYLPYDDSFCAAVAVPVASLSGLSLMPAVGLALLLCLPAALLGRQIDAWIRRQNNDLVQGSGRVMLLALMRSFGAVLLGMVCYISVAGFLAASVRGYLPTELNDALSMMPIAAIMLGLAGIFYNRHAIVQRSFVLIGAALITISIQFFFA